MRCGWTEKEIQVEIDRQIKDSPDSRNLILELAAEAKAKENSWPLRPKYVKPPPLYLRQGKAS
jgi:hypothetical protein